MSEENKEFIVKNVRLCFPESLFTRPTFENKLQDKYECQFLLDPKDPEHKVAIKAISAEVKNLIETELGGDKPENKYCCVKTFDMHTKRGKREEYKDMIYIKCKSKQRPRVVDRTLTMMDKDDERIYGGCRALVKFSLWGADSKFGPTIGGNIIVVQWMGNDEPFGAGHISDEEALEGLEELEPDEELFAAGNNTKEETAEENLFG